jgi:hypothetical protein
MEFEVCKAFSDVIASSIEAVVFALTSSISAFARVATASEFAMILSVFFHDCQDREKFMLVQSPRNQ